MAKARSSSKSTASTATRSTASGDRPTVVDTVEQLAKVVEAHQLSELIVDLPQYTITLRRGGPPVVYAAPVASAPAATAGEKVAMAEKAAAKADDKSHVVTSPFVGTFYRRPNPDAAPYVAVGDRVEKGQVLCIVEAMKLMNEIEADIAGTVTAALVEDSMSVEYGQALYKITPA